MNLILLDFKINGVIVQTHPLYTSCVSATTGQPIAGGDLSQQEWNRLLKGIYIRLTAWWLGSKALASFIGISIIHSLVVASGFIWGDTQRHGRRLWHVVAHTRSNHATPGRYGGSLVLHVYSHHYDHMLV